jgi:hypothetical protein
MLSHLEYKTYFHDIWSPQPQFSGFTLIGIS